MKIHRLFKPEPSDKCPLCNSLLMHIVKKWPYLNGSMDIEEYDECSGCFHIERGSIKRVT